jgi:hypothetical protein
MRGPTYTLILEMSVGHPLLTPEQIAALVGRNPAVVKAVMRSDEFLERRAYLLLERYGDQIHNVRHKLLDVADAMLDAVMKRIADSEDAPVQVLLDAARWIMPFVATPMADPNVKTPLPAQNTVNIFSVPQQALENARQLQAERARTITIPPHPTHAGPPAQPAPRQLLRQRNNSQEGQEV